MRGTESCCGGAGAGGGRGKGEELIGEFQSE